MFKHVKFAELPVTHQERAVQFYTEKLGLRVAQDAPYQEGWRWITLEIPGAATKILFTQRSNEAASDVPSLVLVAADVRTTYTALQQKGVVFTQTPTQAEWNSGETYALLRDSEGNTILIGSE
jgi:lactoylglutathione lyase